MINTPSIGKKHETFILELCNYVYVITMQFVAPPNKRNSILQGWFWLYDKLYLILQIETNWLRIVRKRGVGKRDVLGDCNDITLCLLCNHHVTLAPI